jgi:hypothetical protein
MAQEERRQKTWRFAIGRRETIYLPRRSEQMGR